MILLIIPFLNTFKSFLDLALINKQSRTQIYSYMSTSNSDMFSKRTWIKIVECQSCEFICSPCSYNQMRHLTYKIDVPPRRCLVVCKNNWKCRLDAFISFIHELFRVNKVFFFQTTYNRNHKYSQK